MSAAGTASGAARARRALAVALLVLAASPVPASADGPSLGVAIEAAAEQRTLTQRVVKAYALIGLGNENRQPRVQLFGALERFALDLALVQGFAAGRPAIEQSLARVRALWAPFENLAGGEVARERALSVLAAGDRLLEATEALVAALERESGHASARVVNVAERQRMLSQRLVKAYVYLAWGLDDPVVVNQFVDTWNEFEAAQAELAAYPGNTDELGDALARAGEQWLWLKSALSLYQDKAFYPGIIDDSGEKILADLEQVTLLYHRLLDAR